MVHILIHTSHFITRQTIPVIRIMNKVSYLLIFYGENTEAVMYMSYIQFTITSVSHSPDIITCQSRYGCSIVMRKMAGSFIKVFYSFPISSYPQISIICSNNIGNIIRNDTFRYSLIMPIECKSIVYIIIGI